MIRSPPGRLPVGPRKPRLPGLHQRSLSGLRQNSERHSPARRLTEKGQHIVQVVARTEQHAAALAAEVGAAWTTDIDSIGRNIDVCIYAVSDASLAEVAERVNQPEVLHLHTAGSMPIDVLNVHHNKHYGVLYPFQTFSRQRAVDFDKIPIFIEANDEPAEAMTARLAHLLSNDVRVVTSAQRMAIHVAAVFACNFTNHMYTIAAQILHDQHVPFDILYPLISETAQKIQTMSPVMAQTGPAVRNDWNVINKHLTFLTDEQQRRLYQLITQNIQHSAE